MVRAGGGGKGWRAGCRVQDSRPSFPVFRIRSVCVRNLKQISLTSTKDAVKSCGLFSYEAGKGNTGYIIKISDFTKI